MKSMFVKVTIYCISRQCPAASHTAGVSKREVSMKTPPEHNPGSLELEGRGQVCSVASYLTLLNKVNNCTALLLRRWQEKESWKL